MIVKFHERNSREDNKGSHNIHVKRNGIDETQLQMTFLPFIILAWRCQTCAYSWETRQYAETEDHKSIIIENFKLKVASVGLAKHAKSLNPRLNGGVEYIPSRIFAETQKRRTTATQNF